MLHVHFIFLWRMEGEIPLPRSVSTHIICWTLLVFIWAKAWRDKLKWCKCREDSKICNGLIYLDDKTRSYALLKFAYIFAIDKKLLKIVHFLVLQSMKLSSYIFTKRIILYSDMWAKQFLAWKYINNTEWTIN